MLPTRSVRQVRFEPFLLVPLIGTLFSSVSLAADIHVDPESGDDAANGIAGPYARSPERSVSPPRRHHSPATQNLPRLGPLL